MESGGNPALGLIGLWMLMQLVAFIAMLLGGIYALFCLGRAASGLDRLASAVEDLVERQGQLDVPPGMVAPLTGPRRIGGPTVGPVSPGVNIGQVNPSHPVPGQMAPAGVAYTERPSTLSPTVPPTIPPVQPQPFTPPTPSTAPPSTSPSPLTPSSPGGSPSALIDNSSANSAVTGSAVDTNQGGSDERSR